LEILNTQKVGYCCLTPKHVIENKPTKRQKPKPNKNLNQKVSIQRSNKFLFSSGQMLLILFFFLTALGLELRTSRLLGRQSYCLRHSTSPIWFFLMQTNFHCYVAILSLAFVYKPNTWSYHFSWGLCILNKYVMSFVQCQACNQLPTLVNFSSWLILFCSSIDSLETRLMDLQCILMTHSEVRLIKVG
jgi:hypothetical protein